MTPDDQRCADAARRQQIHEAFRVGDLDALRAAVDDPASIPNGILPVGFGSCLVSAIYHSPLPFIRTLLDLGADPNAPADDGFPPLIAALSCAQKADGATRREDVDDIVRALLASGADPNQRGINDYTPLHMAVAVRQLLAIQILLESGADPDLRTRIDDCDTPLEMAQAAGIAEAAALLARRGQPLRHRLRSGLTLLGDFPGTGEPVRRQEHYRIRLHLAVAGGESVRWQQAWSRADTARLEQDGEILIADVRIERRSLISGLFYGVEGMRIGGTRRLEIAPHVGYGDRGVPGVIPPHATLIAEITIVAATPNP